MCLEAWLCYQKQFLILIQILSWHRWNFVETFYTYKTMDTCIRASVRAPKSATSIRKYRSSNCSVSVTLQLLDLYFLIDVATAWRCSCLAYIFQIDRGLIVHSHAWYIKPQRAFVTKILINLRIRAVWPVLIVLLRKPGFIGYPRTIQRRPPWPFFAGNLCQKVRFISQLLINKKTSSQTYTWENVQLLIQNS